MRNPWPVYHSTQNRSGSDFIDARTRSRNVPEISPGRLFLTTTNGYLCLRSATAQPGDIIAVMIGGAVPYVLRLDAQASRDLENTVYRFVGKCHVHGIMDGEVPAMAREEGGPQTESIHLL